MALIRLKNFATEFSGSFSFGMGATFDSLTQNVEISQRHSERSRPYKSVLISSVCNSTTPSAFQRLRNDTLYCDVCCDLFTEPKLLELPFDDVTQFCHYYRTYFQRFETNILPQCNILCDDIVIPVNYSQLPYNLKNPLFRHWSFLCGGEKFLDLSDLAMNELVDEACKRRSLRGLNLSKNKLDYLSVRRFTRLTNLDTLNLDHNQFTVFPSAVISLTSLTKLSFSHNAITHLPREISMLTNLKNFRAEFNQLQDLPHSFSTLIRLEKLALTGNHWKNPSSIWTTLFSFTSLRCLLLADSHLTEIPAQVSVLTKLKVLDCSKNFISVLPESLATLKNLQILRLGYNRIKSIPNAIMKLQSITRLELNNNEIEQISLTLWSAISKRATLILEHNPLPLNFIKHRKSSLKSSATTSPPLIRQVRESKLQSVNVSGSPKRLGTNDSPWDRTLRSFSSPTMLSSAPTDGEKNEIKKSQSSSSTINTTEKPQIVVVSISSPKKMRIPKTGTPKLQDTNSDETPHTTECSLSYPSAKASMNGVDQNNVSSVSAKSKFSGHREEEKQRLQKDSSDTTSESSRFSVSADTTEQQASSSIESSPNTTPFSSPRRSGPGGLSSSSQLDLDDIDNEVILGGASHNVLKSKLKPKLKTNEKEKLKDKAKLKTNEKDRNEKKMATNKKLERSYSTAVVANNTKNATTDTPDHNNIDNDDDNREMSLLEFLAQVSPTTTRKKTLEDNSKMKRTASVSVIKKRITSKKDDNQQLKEKSKIEKKDKKENKKEMEPSSKWPKSFLSRIGKRKAVAETRKQNQQARSDDHRNTKISHSVPSTPKKSASTPDSNPPSMRRGTVSVERPHEPPLSATVTKRKRGNSTENPPPLQTLSPENAMRPTPSPASEHLKSSASISSSTRSSHKEQLPSSKKEYFAREDKSGPQTTSRNLSSLISPRRTPDPLDFHFRTPTDITTSAASTKLGVDSLSNSPGTHMLDTTKRMRRFDSVRVRSKEQIQTLAQLKTDVKLSPFISRKRKSIKSVSRIDFSSLPPIKEKTFIDFLTADSKVLQIQHRPEGATVVAATADALVELLTHDKGKDARFENAFILAFPSVMTPSTLFELLIRRYHSASVHKDQQKSAVIREKVLEAIELVIRTHSYILKDSEVKTKLTKFLVDMDTSGVDPLKYHDFKQCLKLFSETVRSQPNQRIPQYYFELEDMPAPYLPINVHAENIDLLDLHPEEVARQLTLIEFSLFEKIELHEWFHAKNINDEKAPNINAFIQRFNEVSQWVSSCILLVENLELRTVVMNRFILIACKCFELHNFNGLMEIMSGLAATPVQRLNQTWHSLPPKTLHRYDQLNEIISMSANFKTLRELMNELQPPCIPYLGIYLRDFVFILDGNPEKTENGLINFERLTLLAGLIAKIRQCQLVRYKLCPIEIIQDYLTQSLILLPEEILEAQSYKIEPRKDESAAQLTPKHRASIAFTKRRDT